MVAALEAFADDDTLSRVALDGDGSSGGATLLDDPDELAFLVDQDGVGRNDDAFADGGLERHLANHPGTQVLVGVVDKHLDGVAVGEEGGGHAFLDHLA